MYKKNDTIKSQNAFNNHKERISALTENILKQNNPETKTIVPNVSENKSTKASETKQNNSSAFNLYIPKEKKEQDRLLRATGSYDLKKADPNEINKHLKLKEKTPDDY